MQGLGTTALALATARRACWGAAAEAADSNTSGTGTLTGTEFALQIGARTVNFTGTPRQATVVNGTLPAPLLRWRQGDTVSIRVTNTLSEPTSIHWHGMVLPADMDGVPGISFPGIPPGQSFTYRFPVRQAGTYWYHSHSRFQEQIGLYGPIIIEPRAAERHAADREHIILLSDWTDHDPEHLYRLLKVQSDYFNYNRRTAGDFLADVRRQGLQAALADRRMWGRMRMSDSDLLDVSGHAYTYLMNGVTPAGNWTGLFRRGERVRLRIINGSSMSFFDLRIPGLPMTVIAADGQDVEPVTVEELRIGAAEVYDVLVSPPADRAWTVFAQAMDRTGYARGTLAPAPGMHADVPPLDPRPVLGMSDMGTAMRGMDMQSNTALDDPGVGLRGNGRRVLSYADLHTLAGPLDVREPGREIRLRLTGDMQRFVWSFDDRKFSDAEPIRFQHGERLRMVLINDSMMYHPIHLHGMWSEVESEHGQFGVRKHTVVVQPGQQLAYGVTADAPGRWAFHCHLLYHMEAGMFREVAVQPPGSAG